jgi:hypothetical protein
VLVVRETNTVLVGSVGSMAMTYVNARFGNFTNQIALSFISHATYQRRTAQFVCYLPLFAGYRP